MKKLLGILVLGLLWCNVGVAGTRLIESTQINVNARAASFIVSTLCIDGYKFVMSKGGGVGFGSRSMVQFFETRDGKSLPAKC